MGPKTSSRSSDRRRWDKIFNGMLKVIRLREEQLASFSRERSFLEDRIKLLHDRWVFDVNLYNDQISQMKNEFRLKEMDRNYEASKHDLVNSLKKGEASRYKLQLEAAERDLEDFEALINHLSTKHVEPNEISEIGNNQSGEQCCKALENELKRLKCENEKHVSKNNTDMSALLAEKKFVWNQYNKMENDLTDQINRKNSELQSANKKIQRLLSDMEKLQFSNTEKDDKILTLNTTVEKLNSDLSQKSEEIKRLSREWESLRRSKGDFVTPTLRRCTTGSGASHLKTKNTGNVDKALHSSEGPEKVCRNPKRKLVDAISMTEPPKLFTSSFKVPKLKSPSSLT